MLFAINVILKRHNGHKSKQPVACSTQGVQQMAHFAVKQPHLHTGTTAVVMQRYAEHISQLQSSKFPLQVQFSRKLKAEKGKRVSSNNIS